MEKTEKPTITISATISSDLEKVWEFYTDPEHITQWNFATEEWHCPNAKNDLKVGGKLWSRMEAKDGSFGFDYEAIYDEIIPQKKIIYTLGDGRKVIIDFEKGNEMTKVTTNFEAEKENPLEMQRDGWQAILDNFKKYVEANS